MDTKTPALCPVHKLDYDTFGKYATSTIPVEDFLYKKLLGPSDILRVAKERCDRFGEDIYINTDKEAVTRFFTIENYIAIKYCYYSIIRLDIFNKSEHYALSVETLKDLVHVFLKNALRRQDNLILGYCYSLELGEFKDKRKRDYIKYREIDEERWHCHLHLFLDCRSVLPYNSDIRKDWIQGVCEGYRLQLFKDYNRLFRGMGEYFMHVQKKWLSYPNRPVINSNFVLERNSALNWLSYICKETRKMVEYRQQVPFAKLHMSNRF